MVRPRISKTINNLPKIVYFKPAGVPLVELQEVVLSISEFESLRLKDYENMNEKNCADKMQISQPTFNRLYNNAKKKLIYGLVEGFAIKIEGGNYNMNTRNTSFDTFLKEEKEMPNRDGSGPSGAGPKTGRGLGNCPDEKVDNKNTNQPKENQNIDRPLGLGRGRRPSTRRGTQGRPIRRGRANN